MQAGQPDAKTGVQKAEDAEEELRRKSTQVMMLVIVLVMVILWITRFTFS